MNVRFYLSYDVKTIFNLIFRVITLRCCHLIGIVIMDIFVFRYSILLHGVISLPEATSCDNVKQLILVTSEFGDFQGLTYWCSLFLAIYKFNVL